ncbi:MAG TPA: bifunctional YncE family protein/alkaline phosphatase family protein [Bryobacteraceae bacterium]|nr:bifunctional YncE family protein/alkaline phosphatase family protein [Bryobacteraceae bacterium]
MKRTRLILAAVLISAAGLAIAATINRSMRIPDVKDSTGAVTLPNGWRISPAGKHVPLPGDLPMKMAATGDGARILVLTAGYHDHSLNVIDPRTQELVSTLNVVKSWDGMAFDAATGMVYLSGGGHAKRGFAEVLARMSMSPVMKESVEKPILRARYSGGKLTPEAPISINGLDEKDRFISGLALGPGGALYALNIQTDTLYRLSGADFAEQTSVKTGYRPYGVVFSPDGNTLAVSNWGDRSVSLLDARSLRETARVAVGSHPNEMVWAKDGRLFVTDSGSNDVSIIRNGAVVETVRTSLTPNALVGSTPDALALSPDGRRLYVANADNNNVAVIDVSGKESRVLGFVPTGWYPTTIAVSNDGKQLYVGTGKGMGFRNNYPGSLTAKQQAPNPKTPYDYIAGVLSGHLSIVDVPDARQLAEYTRRASSNVPAPAEYVDSAWAGKIQRDVFPKIKHVLYIIRENRTYDQVFGDLGVGNGDPSLTLFGQQVTPNAHAYAKRWVTLDNLYCDGEVSEDGHQWSNAAYATDFNQKSWTNSYSQRAEPEADERLESSPAGYLWDACARKGLSFRTYGEMASFKSTPESEPEVKAVGSLAGHVSTEWLKVKAKGGRDTDKAAVFIKELQQAEQSGDWPNFMVMSLGEDHTQGLRPGTYTPVAAVASNDQALGQIVQAVSHSRFWKETAIFVIEDDAQNGPDHVDAHRTVGLVVSPWIKRGIVDSSMYTTSSFVRTMELILGLNPMTQFDAAATPMFASFSNEPSFDAVDLVPAQTDLMARNPATGPGARASLKLDFSDYDRADPDELNEILWSALKPGKPMPAPVRSARVR